MKSEVEAVRVWDLPTRLFHWALAVCVVASIVTAHVGGNAMVWHFRIGYAVFTLLAFRLVWGFTGGRWSRFASFVRAPKTTLRYLRGQTLPEEHLDVGHNPLGAWSVIGLIGILAVQVGTGLFADDEIASAGPLNKFVSDKAASLASNWHANIGQWVIVALVTLHVAAILFYLLRKKHNLVRPMLSGDKPLAADVPAALDSGRSRFLASVIFAGCAWAVAWVVSLGG